jgi:hypothetical protein
MTILHGVLCGRTKAGEALFHRRGSPLVLQLVAPPLRLAARGAAPGFPAGGAAG